MTKDKDELATDRHKLFSQATCSAFAHFSGLVNKKGDRKQESVFS